MKKPWLEWLEDRMGLWAFLSVIIAIVAIALPMIWDRKDNQTDPTAEPTRSPSPSPSAPPTQIPSSVPTVTPVATPAPSEPAVAEYFTVVESELFDACGLTGLKLHRLLGGQGIAALEKHNGFLYDNGGNPIEAPAMKVNFPLALSGLCTLTISSVESVQGHNSYSVIIKRTHP